MLLLLFVWWVLKGFKKFLSPVLEVLRGWKEGRRERG
jgi:hypothetical protein